MNRASATAGSSMVTMRPTMTRPLGPFVVALASATLVDDVGDAGVVAPGPQPVTMASDISRADQTGAGADAVGGPADDDGRAPSHGRSGEELSLSARAFGAALLFNPGWKHRDG